MYYYDLLFNNKLNILNKFHNIDFRTFNNLNNFIEISDKLHDESLAFEFIDEAPLTSNYYRIKSIKNTDIIYENGEIIEM